jgi:hypothetical protein
MKKLVKSVLMLSIASLAILSSCKKETTDEVTDVTVTITPSPSASLVDVGTVLTLTIEAKGNTDNKLKKITVTSTQSGSALLSKTLSVNSTTEIVRDTLKKSNETYSYTVTVEGEKGSPATKTYTVKTKTVAAGVNVTNAIPLFGQTNGAGTNANFMQLTDPHGTFSTSTFVANKAKVDVAFFYGSINKATLTSPSDATMQGLYSGLNWTGANVTKLYKTSMTVAEFEAVATAKSDAAITTLAASVATSAWVSSISQLSRYNVILYKTAGNKLGLIKVDNLSATGPNDAEISLQVISQKN